MSCILRLLQRLFRRRLPNVPINTNTQSIMMCLQDVLALTRTM